MSTRPGGEELVERLDVAREAGDDAAGRSAAEPGDLEPLQVGEQGVAQVPHHELPGHQHRARLEDQQDGRAEQAHEEEHGQGRESRRRPRSAGAAPG